MVAHLEWNCSRLRKLMKLSPGPVSVHPSQVSCITLQSLEPGCEAKERSAAGRRKSIARDCHEVPRFNRGDRTRPVAVSFSVAFHVVPSFDTKVRNVSLHVSSFSLVAYLWCVKTFTSVGPRYSVGEVRAHTTRPQPLGQALVLQFTLAQALVVPWWDLALAQGSTKAHQGLAQGTTKARWVPW